jgi:hypothetical protein
MLRVSLSIPVYLMHIVILHFGLTLQEVDLRGTKSMEEIIAKIQAFSKVKTDFIVGNGWDQNDYGKRISFKSYFDKYLMYLWS